MITCKPVSPIKLTLLAVMLLSAGTSQNCTAGVNSNSSAAYGNVRYVSPEERVDYAKKSKIHAHSQETLSKIGDEHTMIITPKNVVLAAAAIASIFDRSLMGARSGGTHAYRSYADKEVSSYMYFSSFYEDILRKVAELRETDPDQAKDLLNKGRDILNITLESTPTRVYQPGHLYGWKSSRLVWIPVSADKVAQIKKAFEAEEEDVFHDASEE